jgi:hypothetical protein
MKQLSSLLVPRGSTLLPNKDSILLFPISVFTLIFQNPENSAIHMGQWFVNQIGPKKGIRNCYNLKSHHL